MDLRVAAYAVIVDERGMLLAHWHEGPRAAWTLPGGGLEAGEDPADAVVREVREETGFEVTVEELLGIHSRVIPARQRLAPGASGPLHTLRIVYRARVVGGDLRDEVGGSTDRAAWFTLDAVERLHRVQLVDLAREMAGV
ncbi:MAG: NUDIX hydrolase [Microbacterium sp.]|uniref:NUDIX hydrolase n=1 Tax=Microbacterium sp. TaxID=51671 RepID=UPI001AD3EAA9|nr:NUDIX hydrolase [Microbacterium sp.]MBN9176858.1 NUDIX hydrolase [Microbacterium sp.]